jgi:cobalt-zinc-cadmium efflux system outer membrane protein
MTHAKENLIVFSLVLALASSASAAQVAAPPQPGAPSRPGGLEADPLLATLIQQAWASRPELAQARSRLAAQRERVPQAGALPDPTLTLGLQNDGFRAIEIGRMEASWGILMASQTFPWLGKRGLRSELASLEARAAQADLARAELSLRAEVERGYLDLLVVRGQLELLGRLRALWSQAEGLARARYEVGEGEQTDILRAQLEVTRLRQRRIGLAAEERRRLAVLNRVRGAPLDATLPTPRSAADLPDPPLLEAAEALAEAEARSPELERARLAVRQAERRSELADKEAVPDPTLTLGIMPRGGPFEPMWQATVSLPLPVWAGRKQARALAENRALQRASSEGLEAVRQLLRQRLAERRALIAAAREMNELFRKGLLVQSEATVTSALAQYQVGRLAFASVLEALQGYVADQSNFLDSIASAQRLAIAERELSLESVEGPPTGGMSGAAFPLAGGASSSAAAIPSTSPATGESASGSAMPSRM